jgi:serine O-acetyltransferase
MQTSELPPLTWELIRNEVKKNASKEPLLTQFFTTTILQHNTLGAALSHHLANILDSSLLPASVLRDIIDAVLTQNPQLVVACQKDIIAVRERDPVCHCYSTPLLYFKGFHALQAHRISHALWHDQQPQLALLFQSRISTTLNVDIHPAARLGCGIMLDHATGIVIGETAVVEDDVSMLHSVTLGGTGNVIGDRHPKIGRGVLIGAGAKILGNVRVGEGAKIAAGSVVLHEVTPHTTVAGVPAKPIGQPKESQPARAMNHCLEG